MGTSARLRPFLASEVYDEAGVIAITPGSTNPAVTERGLGAMFRMCGRDDQQGIVAGDYIVDVLKGKKVVVLHDKDTYGQGLADPRPNWPSVVSPQCCMKA